MSKCSPFVRCRHLIFVYLEWLLNLELCWCINTVIIFVWAYLTSIFFSFICCALWLWLTTCCLYVLGLSLMPGVSWYFIGVCSYVLESSSEDVNRSKLVKRRVIFSYSDVRSYLCPVFVAGHIYFSFTERYERKMLALLLRARGI